MTFDEARRVAEADDGNVGAGVVVALVLALCAYGVAFAAIWWGLR